MRKAHYQTIIIGGGVAGLACANELSKQGHDFLLVSKNLGGRLCSSWNDASNYGAYVIPNTDEKILHLVERTQRIRLFHLDFHRQKQRYSFLEIFSHQKEFFHFIPFLVFYRSLYKKFRAHAMQHGQAAAFSAFPLVYELYQTPATRFIRDRGIQTITDRFLCEPVWMCTFAPIANLNAFDFMHIVMNLGVPVYKFRTKIQEVIHPYKKRIRLAEVKNLYEADEIQLQLHDKSTLWCRQLVLATPLDVTHKFLNVQLNKKPCSAHLFHVKGILRPEFTEGDLELFHEREHTIFFSQEADGTTIFYSTTKKPNLERFFLTHTILYHRHWNPAFYLGGNTIIDPCYSKQITLAGDFNIVGMEDSYISGLFAARRVLTSLRSAGRQSRRFR